MKKELVHNTDSRPPSPAPRKPKRLFSVASNPLAALLKALNEFLLELDVNGAFLGMWGLQEALLYGHKTGFPDRQALDIRNEEVFRPFRKLFQRVIKTRKSEDIEFPIDLAGERRWFRARVSAVSPDVGKAHSVALLAHDITAHKKMEERLQKQEALLAQAEQLANIGSWEINANSEFALWSDHLYRMLGFAPQESPVPLAQVWRMAHPDDVAISRKHLREAATLGEPFEHDMRLTLANGRHRIFHTRGAPVWDAEGRVVRIVGVTQDVTEPLETEENLRHVSQQLLTLRDHEQKKMSHDLHETAAQSMAALKMTMGRLTEIVPKQNKRAHKLLRSSAKLANEAIQQVRTVSYLLHPPLLEEAGLGPALRWYASGFSERSGIEVKVTVSKFMDRLPRQTEMVLFRVVQEALTNVHRHSKSRNAAIRLTSRDGFVRIEVQDEGIGMAVPSAAAGWNSLVGIGVAGIRERVKQLNGTLEIQSAPGRGTTIRVEAPVGELKNVKTTITKNG
jgi:PAS domain S-box-containing protein